MRIKWISLIICFFLFYLLAYCVFDKVKAEEPKGPTITVPYTEEQMCKAFLRAEICEMSQEDQEKYFLEIFKAFIDQKLGESFNKYEEVDICLEMVDRKLIPCAEGIDI